MSTNFSLTEDLKTRGRVAHLDMSEKQCINKWTASDCFRVGPVLSSCEQVTNTEFNRGFNTRFFFPCT